MHTVKSGMKAFGASLALVFLLNACASSGAPRTGAITAEGLREIHIEGLDYLAVHRAADLSGYRQIYIEPVTVEFAPGWRPTQTGSRLPASPQTLERLHETIKERFMASFGNAFEANPRYTLVDQPAPGSLRITPVLTEVSVAIVDLEGKPRDVTARNLGHFEIDLTIHDVRTGELVLHMKDSRDSVQPASGMSLGNMISIASEIGRTVSSTTMLAEMDRIFDGWGALVAEGFLNSRIEN